MESVLLVIHIVVCISLVGVILLQPNSSDGLSGIGGGSGSGGGFMSARGTANFMTKLTAILATIFIVNSLILAYLVTHGNQKKGIDSILPAADSPMPAVKTPLEPSKPAVPLAK